MLKRLLNFKIIFFLASTAIILSLNLTPLIADFRHSPPGRTFALIHNNVQDFFFYQSLMNKGAAGDWLTTDPYTTELHQPSIIFAYFVWLGKISKILGLPYVVTYHLLRIILSILFLFFIFYFLFFISIPYPRLAFFFFVFAAPFIHQINDGGKLISVPYMNWWTGMDPIRRAAYLPHHMFGGLFLVISIILIIKYFHKPKIKYLLSLIFISFLLAFVHTPSLFIILLMLPPSVITYYFINININSKFKLKNYLSNLSNQSNSLFSLFFYWVIGLFFLLLMLFQTNRGFPWSQYISWEKKLQFPLDKELMGALGILLPFSIIGLFKALFSKRFEYILTASWFISPFLLIPFAPHLNISNIRLIQGVPYLPLSILAVLGIRNIENLLGKVFHKSAKLKAGALRASAKLSIRYAQDPEHIEGQFKVKKFIKINNLSHCLIVSLFLIFTLPTLSWSLKDQVREYWPIFGNVYLDNRMSKAFSFINQNFPKNTRTLSTFYAGNYLPTFTHTISYIGHSGYTYNTDKKQPEVMKFFENKMPDAEAKDFLLSNKIALIFQGPEEKPLYNNYLYSKLLKPIYDEEPVTLYRLK